MNKINLTKKNFNGKSKTVAQIRKELKEKYKPPLIKVLQPLAAIAKRSQSSSHESILIPEKKFKKLYSILSNPSFLIQALGNIASNKGALTPGPSNYTIDAISLKKIELISKSLKNSTFKFKPFKRIMIPKPAKKGLFLPQKYRPLGIPDFNDRIVQEGIRMILNSIYEPIFEYYNCNYGFRPKKSCQQAIQAIKINGTACDFAIEGDIVGAFDNVDFDIMLNIF